MIYLLTKELLQPSQRFDTRVHAIYLFIFWWIYNITQVEDGTWHHLLVRCNSVCMNDPI